VGGSLITAANITDPQLYIVNVFGPWNGTIQGVPLFNVIYNYITGANSQNDNSLASSNSNAVTVNQNATAHNYLTVDATTGSNTITNNSKVSGLTTGSVNVLANVLNFMNTLGSNLKNLRIGVINIFSSNPPPAQGALSTQTTPALPQNTLTQTSNPSAVFPSAITITPGGQPYSSPTYSVKTHTNRLSLPQSNTPFTTVIAASQKTASSSLVAQPAITHDSQRAIFDTAYAAGGNANTAVNPFTTFWKVFAVLAAWWILVEIASLLVRRKRV
jgi:hypothetical protein